MLKELFLNSDLLDLPLLTMAFFMSVFGLVLLRVFSRSRQPHYHAMANLPLETAPASPERSGREDVL